MLVPEDAVALTVTGLVEGLTLLVVDIFLGDPGAPTVSESTIFGAEEPSDCCETPKGDKCCDCGRVTTVVVALAD